MRLAPGAQAERRRRVLMQNFQAYAFILPALLVLGVFHILPGAAALVMSTLKWRVVFEGFAGFDNYAAILDPSGARFGEFVNSFAVTISYVLLTVPFEMAIALAVAYVLFTKLVGRAVYRTVYFLPYITSTVAAAAIFGWIFNPEQGFMNWLLNRFGVGAQRWTQEPRGLFELVGSAVGVDLSGPLAGPSLALVSVAIFTVWHFVGFQTVVFMAGLANIDRQYYEAARIDGANELQLFRHITLPLLSPTTFFVLVIATIGAMRAFNQIYILTNGGPLDTTRTVTMEIFRTFYQRGNNIGLGSAMAFVLVGIILALTFVQFRLVGRRVQYQ